MKERILNLSEKYKVGKTSLNCVFLSIEGSVLKIDSKKLFKCECVYLVGECVVAKGTMLDLRIDSNIVDSVTGRYCKSSIDGKR